MSGRGKIEREIYACVYRERKLDIRISNETGIVENKERDKREKRERNELTEPTFMNIENRKNRRSSVGEETKRI